MSVRIYVEGGGDLNATLARCRGGFAKLFENLLTAQRKPKVIACGGRDQAFRDFCTALREHPGDTILLLVDSEEAPTVERCWEHLRRRDKWIKPDNVTDKQVYLMVQCMESWFLADKSALAKFYGDKFLVTALPANPQIEDISKVDVSTGLERATRATQKGAYHKTRHGFDILAVIDPLRVGRASPQAQRLMNFLLENPL